MPINECSLEFWSGGAFYLNIRAFMQIVVSQQHSDCSKPLLSSVMATRITKPLPAGGVNISEGWDVFVSVKIKLKATV